MASIIKKTNKKVEKQSQAFLSDKFSKIKSWTPQKKKLFAFTLLFVLAVPCFILIASNVKNKSSKFSSFSLFNANLNLNEQKDIKDSLSQAVESTKQIQENLDIASGIEDGELSTSDIQEMLDAGIITQDDLDELNASSSEVLPTSTVTSTSN